MAETVFIEAFGSQSTTAFDADRDASCCTAAITDRGLEGHCSVCGKDVRFAISSDNFREDLICPEDGSNARRRSLVAALGYELVDDPTADLDVLVRRFIGARARILIIEPNVGLARRYGANMPRRQHEIIELASQKEAWIGDGGSFDFGWLDYPDRYFDLVLSSDIMQSVADVQAADAEFMRILRPGGLHVFTVPFDPNADEDFEAVANWGAGGEQAFRVFSLRGLAERFASLGAELATYRIWSEWHGILGANSVVQVARSPVQREEVSAGEQPETDISAGAEPLRIAELEEEVTCLKEGLELAAFQRTQTLRRLERSTAYLSEALAASTRRDLVIERLESSLAAVRRELLAAQQRVRAEYSPDSSETLAEASADTTIAVRARSGP